MDFMDLTNPDYAYMFGFLQTDGHLSWGKGLKGRLEVEIKRADEAILHEFKRLTPYNSAITRRERDTNFKAGYQSSTWRMCALEGRMRVQKLGLIPGRKSDWLAPPSVEHSASDYVRGLIDGDGSVGFTAQGLPFVSFVTASAFLADYFSDFVADATGCRHRCMRNRRDGVFNLAFMADPAVELARRIYPPDGIALDRKRAAAVAVAEWLRPATMRAAPPRRRWTQAEDEVLIAHTVPEAAQLLKRSENSCYMRRWHIMNGDRGRTAP